MHRVEAGHHVAAGGPEWERFDGSDEMPGAQTRVSVADARLREHRGTQVQADGHDLHGEY